MKMLRYFAYGSNMLTERIRTRVGSAHPLGAAALTGMTLDFAKRGPDLSGKAMIAPAPDRSGTVHGVLFEVAEDEIAILDGFEGPGYSRDTVEVQLAAGGTLAAQVYVPRPDYLKPGLRPYDWYLGLILAGARQHGLSSDWIATLGARGCLPDPVSERPTRVEALRLLAGIGVGPDR